MTLQNLKEEARDKIIKDTRRVYVRTVENPDGELIQAKEFDDFLDSLITKAYEEGRKTGYEEGVLGNSIN